MSDGFGGFGAPDDGPRLLALALAALSPWVVPRLLRPSRHPWRFAAIAAACAAALSTAYVRVILRGGPRIIDATAYWLQARALAAGWLAWPLSEPEHAVLGRFLLRSGEPWAWWPGAQPAVATEAAVSVIFPPGYPTVLALGHALGVPLLVGPALAAALVVATMHLSRQVVRSAARAGIALTGGAQHDTALARLAGVLSVLCVGLRYHTADTMSHGLAALCFTVGLTSAVAVADAERPSPAVAAIAGLALGWLACTRPVSAMALAGCLLVLLVTAWRRGRLRGRGLATMLPLCLGVVPGLAWWAVAQLAATGSMTTPAQTAYYALSDGPPGCFAYGFGPGIGCLGEHGTFVGHRLSEGYGALEAMGTTLRRVEMHLSDPLNFAPLFGLVLLGAWLGRAVPAIRALSLGVALQVLAYGPFYFDGNYPGGGARMFADVLPLEHVLAATGLVLLAARAPAGRPRLTGLAAAVVMLGLGGFALRSGAQHAQLRDREGGRPMFESAVVSRAQAADALLFVDTDHGFNLAHQPGATRGGAVRYRGDDLDRLAWEARGRPEAYRYRYDLSRPGGGWLEPLDFDQRPTAELALRLEAESLWPPEGQTMGWVWPRHRQAPCVSAGRVLQFQALPRSKGAPAAPLPQVVLRLPATALRGRALRVQVILDGPAPPGVDEELVLHVDGRRVHRWPLPAEPAQPCLALPAAQVPETARFAKITLRARRSVGLDRIDAEPPES